MYIHKNWGLHIQMILWLNAMMITSITAYGSMVWWPTTQQARILRLVKHVQLVSMLVRHGSHENLMTTSIKDTNHNTRRITIRRWFSREDTVHRYTADCLKT